MENFAKGLVTGEPDDLVGLAGTAVGDLFVIGDIRDAVREGTRLAAGQKADELILGLACVGLAVTAGTYVSLGAVLPVRIGLTLVKAARQDRQAHRPDGCLDRTIGARSGRLPGGQAHGRQRLDLAARAGRAWRARGGEGREGGRPGQARRRCRACAGKAGTQAALDGLKIAHGPKDMAKVATLATAKGGKTRAILKLAGRSAIMLTMGAFNLASWMFWAAFTVFGFVSSLKRMTERSTERYCARRRARIARAERRLGEGAGAGGNPEAGRRDRRGRRAAGDLLARLPAWHRARGRTEPTSLKDAIASLRGPLRTQVA